MRASDGRVGERGLVEERKERNNSMTSASISSQHEKYYKYSTILLIHV